MKLIDGFIGHELGEEHIAVSAGEAAKVFHGLIRANKSAYFILEMLMEDITETEIVEAVYERYDAPKEQIAADVHGLLQKLRDARVLEE